MTQYPLLAAAMTTKSWITLAIILVVVGVVLFLLYRYGKKMEAKQADAQQQIEATKQYVSILVIDKKKMKPAESGLPKEALSQLPWYAKRQKLAIVKAKVGPQILSLMCDDDVFQVIPVKKECKVAVSGIYIAEIKSVRGGQIPEKPKKQKWYKRLLNKAQNK